MQASKQALTFDLETQTKLHNKRRAQRWHPDNYIVAAGWKYGQKETFGDYFNSAEEASRISIPDLDNVGILVGLNIKFDLLWLWDNPAIKEYFKKGGDIWCCQYAEYLIQGQQEWAHMLSMNELVEMHGGTLKLDAVKELWEAGVETSDIPKDLLMDYLLGNPDEDLEGDVNNTYIIFVSQLHKILTTMPKNSLQMIKNRMTGLLATTEIEFNGLKVDLELGTELRTAAVVELEELTQELVQYLPQFPEEFEFNWNSIYHKSYLLYGGTARYKSWVQHLDPETDEPLYAKKTIKWPLYNNIATDPDKVPADVKQDSYKSGKKAGELKFKNQVVPNLDKPKGAQQDKFIKFPGFTKPKASWKSTLQDPKGKHLYSTASDVIKELSVTTDIPFLKNVARRQKLSKEIGTYYWEANKAGNIKGMLTLVNEVDGCIHHKLNHVNTVTGRLSSSDPNMQNTPKKNMSKVKQVFVSRFRDKGVIAELDYSSLEVVVQAVLTGDKQLIKDLNNGVDFHCKRLAAKLHMDYAACKEAIEENRVFEVLQNGTETIEVTFGDLRTRIKSFTFARAYGAGAISIAYDTGMSVDEVQSLIKIEDAMYTGVVAFDKYLEGAINKSRVSTSTEVWVDGKRFKLGRGEWYSPTGTRFVWKEAIAPEFLWKHKKFVGFKPTERKNYPPQGVGGEIVQTMIGLVYRYFAANDNFNNEAFMINTVHDSVYLDLLKTRVHEVIPIVKAILEAVPEKYKKDFNIDIPVKFPVEAEVGSSMWHTEHYDPKQTY